MKYLLLSLTLPLFVALSAYAQDDHQHGGMMQHGDMSKMQEHMQQMHTLMESLKKEDNPEKREELIQQHMQSMQNGMHMMNRMDGGDMSSMGVEERVQMMERRMEMMQDMMGQMLDHSAQAQKSRKNPHIKK